MKKRILLAMTVILSGIGVLSTSANLIMKVNTVNKTFSFEGTDTGAGQYYGYQNHYEVGFSSGGSGTWMGNGPNPVDVGTAFPTIADVSIYIYNDEGIGLGFSSGEDGPDISSITAVSSEIFSYSGWHVDSKTALENATGNTMALKIGSGDSAVAIQAIPEPATMGLIAFFGGSVFVLRRVFMI